MLLVLTLFWRRAVPGLCAYPNCFPPISRFDVFNSRLGRFNSRLAMLRELACKGLICHTIFAAEQ
jgi:hypothetical protein